MLLVSEKVITTISFLISPVMCLCKNRRMDYFLFCIMNLFIVQLFMYPPGMDVSPYAYAVGELHSIKFIGLTLSAMMSITIIVFVFFCLVYKRKLKKASLLLSGVAIPCLLSLIIKPDFLASADSIMKLVAPFIITIFFYEFKDEISIRKIKKLIFIVNVFLLGQVILCKIFTGHFAAHIYYHELAEEYFGYYNHPHPFTCILAILCIYNVYNLIKKDHISLNIILLLLNIVFMYLSQVRTYILALVIALGFMGFLYLYKNMKHIRKLLYLFILVVPFIMLLLFSSLGSARVTGDISSGRIERWTSDIQYALDNYSVIELLFGRGIDSVHLINSQIFDVSINSLNLIVDFFIDFGLIGLVFFLCLLYMMFKIWYTKRNSIFFFGFVVFFIVASLINSIISYVTIMLILIVVLFILKIEGECENESFSTESTTVS